MAHEIYYTSAPQGLRRGSRGFCTVAATEGIPRPLWDRLESLSGYSHIVDRGAAGPGPVCHAHWLLNLEGREYHVLSRIGDAGLDYTQRTNALAHHVVLDEAELAAGGPAWLAAQASVLIDRWDGRVGPIVRYAPLPRGDCWQAPCATWQRLTGDAGWAGVVAQAIVTTPWKPIGLLFGPNQSVLPLIAEVTALLPAASRWQATFNTYFTNLPSGVSCQWRCCVAGTPAAATLRSMAGSAALMIDLTQPHALKPPPENAWTEAARRGQLMPVGTKPAPRATVPSSGIIPFAPEPGTPAAPAAPPKATTFTGRRGVAPLQPIPIDEDDVLPEPPVAAGSVAEPAASQERVVIHRGSRAESEPEDLGQRSASAPQPEISWAAQQRRDRQRRMMLLYAIACAVIAIGFWLATWAHRSSSDFSLPAPVRKPATAPATTEASATAAPEPLTSAPETRPAPAQPAQNPIARVDEKSRTPPVTTRPTTVAMVPLHPAIAVTQPAGPPAPIVLDQPLPQPPAGKGLRDVVSSLALPAGKIQFPQAARMLRIVLPDRLRQWRFDQEELTGTFDARTAPDSSKPTCALTWRDAASPAGPSPVVTVALDRAAWQLEFTWNTSLMLRRPHLSELAYWILQNSELTFGDSMPLHTQTVTFGPVALKPGRLSGADLSACLPANLPLAPKLVPKLPTGWHGGPASLADVPGSGATQSLRLEKPTAHAPIPPGFSLRLSWPDRSLACDLIASTESTKAELAAREAEAKQAAELVKQVYDNHRPLIAAAEESVNQWTARHRRGIDNPQPGEATAEQVQVELKRARARLSESIARRDTALVGPMTQQKEAENRCAGLRETLMVYGEVKELELVVELPQGLRVGVLRLVRDTE